jgi:hypothetical protein
MPDWNRSDQHPELLLEPDPVVAGPFRFAPVLVGGDAWPLFSAEMLVEGLVVHEGRPLTPLRGMAGSSWLGAEPETVEPTPAPVGVPVAGVVALGLAGLPVGLVMVEAPPVAPVAAPRVSAESETPVPLRSATIARK